MHVAGIATLEAALGRRVSARFLSVQVSSALRGDLSEPTLSGAAAARDYSESGLSTWQRVPDRFNMSETEARQQ